MKECRVDRTSGCLYALHSVDRRMKKSLDRPGRSCQIKELFK